ncbi:hypothetical protein [Methylobacterium haplocladii]|uniref:Uncharacterized protein n=1 Tax=Methylobacterium haplocladii TaxID=1176176 RepID=A0A512IP88_9HYPH|nr:hypothetical protein [Methylobacterium haplocladii]GEO99517.1 hypothetical protein MHA02_19050 [Methylobacterium haplocladii]GJD83660.1 hypothetical protein HPGCJGGD_1530 [Methylobacterium haplocladii]GLS59744.1 hypothetical protein GCM10007887_24160 [Methylobacterium haplocladii]
MSKRTTQLTAPKPDTGASLCHRATLLRDAAGRFTKRDADTSKAQRPKLGYMLRPPGVHPNSYGLRVDENGAGVKMPPGSSVLVEPIPPRGRDFCVAYFVNGRGPSIWQIGESFDPAFLQAGEGSEVFPMIELFDPIDGRRGFVDCRKIEKLHRVHGVTVPIDVLEEFGPAPADLPLLSDNPEGCLEHVVEDATNWPVLRPGDIALVDITKTELMKGALVLLKWNSGACSILQTNYRDIGGIGPRWWVDPINRPQGPGMMELRQKRSRLLYASDGPYTVDLLQEKLIGTVVGIRSRKRPG